MFKAEWPDRSGLHFEKLHPIVGFDINSWGLEVCSLVTGGLGASKCLPLLSAGLCGAEGTALPVGGNREAKSFHKEVFSTGCGFAKLEPALLGGRGPLTEGVRAEAAGDGEAVWSGEASSWEEAVGWSAVFSWFPQSPGGCAEPLGRCCDEGQVGRAVLSPRTAPPLGSGARRAKPKHFLDLELEANS